MAETRTLSDRIGEMARELDLELLGPDDPLHIRLSRGRSPFIVHLDLRSTDVAVIYVSVRTTSWDFPGERTDVHECLSMLLAYYLRTSPPFISSTMLDVRNGFGLASEVYARYLTFEQPFSSMCQLDKDGLTRLYELLSAMREFEFLAGHLVSWDIKAEQSANVDMAQNWAREVAQVIGEPIDDEVQFVARKNPSWLHYRSIRTGITVWKSRRMAESLLVLADHDASKWETLPGIQSRLYVGHETYNAVSYKAESMMRNLLNQLNDQITPDDMRLVPFENYLVAIGGEVVIAARRSCDRKRFEAQRERIRARYEREGTLLFPKPAASVPDIVWQDPVDDEQFELLILALLKREPGVVWARKVSVSNEPDSGRDLLCEWNTLPSPHQDIVGDRVPDSTRRVVVQCKAYKAPVNKSNVRDIRDTVEHFGADGYFLAVASSLTGGLFDHLDKLRQDGKIWVNWWTRNEIEDRLRKHMTVARRFNHVVALSAPNTTGDDA